MSDNPDAPRLKRKLAVILASDVAGYSALIAQHEEATIRRFNEASGIMHGLVAQQSGRVFNTAGDAILAEFDSAVNAVRCALDVQDALASLNGGYDPARPLQLRIGIAIGDVVVAPNGDLLGDGVNIAARLQTLAQPGGVTISRDVQQLVVNKIALGFDDIGAQTLKNIPQPVYAFHIRTATEGAALARVRPARWTLNRAVAAGLAAAVLAAGTAWWVNRGMPAEVAGAGRAFEAGAVPLVADDVRQKLLQSYANATGHKALAISNDGEFHGIAVNAVDAVTATERARETCERDSTVAHKRPCFSYAAGNRVLVDPNNFPMPLPAEISRQSAGVAFGVNDTPLAFMQQGRRLSNEYPAETRPKALAIGTRGEGVWGAQSAGATEAEAIRRALEFCGFRTRGPCILYAVGPNLVTRPPTLRKLVGVLSFSVDKAIPVGERERLIAAYTAGGDWQALAFGRNGTWHAETGTTTEVAAIDGALAKCRSADRECKLYAIGRFLVAPE